MSSLAASQAATVLPFDVEHMLQTGDCTCAGWPLSVSDLQGIQRRWRAGMLAAIQNAGDMDAADALLLGAFQLQTQTLAMLQAATLLARAQERGLEVAGGPTEVDFLRAGSADGTPPASSMPDLREIPVSRRPLARSLVSTAQYNRWIDVLPALIGSNRLLVAHNPTLAEYLRRHPRPLRFLDSGTLFHRSLQRAGTEVAATVDTDDLVAYLLGYIASDLALPEPILGRVRALIAAKARAVLSRCLAQVQALSRVPLPDELVGSSAAQYAARAIAIAMRRRGGTSYFSVHAGSSSVIKPETSFALQELAVASTFVLPTRTIAEQPELQAAADLLHPLPTAKLVGGSGLPPLRQMPASSPAATPSRPRVLYVSTILRGFAVTGIKPLADPIYLDWQLRLARWLGTLPVQLLCKPHPGGFFKGREHPLETVAPTSYAMFESLIGETDIFVFDNCTTTTLWEAVCSDRPIVYFDMRLFEFTALAAPILRRRCRFVDVEFDEMNTPQFDTQVAEAAVLDATPVDPAEIRGLFLD